MMVPVKKLPLKIYPSSSRTLIRPFIPANITQIEHILLRTFSVSPKKQKQVLDRIYDSFDLPREKLKTLFLKHFDNIKNRIPSNLELSETKREFIGAYFTQQYALESTALFNPSMIPHPFQPANGNTKFIISLRAIGEGHVSSITFMEGEIDTDFNIQLKEKSPVIFEPERLKHHYEKKLFIKKAQEINILTAYNQSLFDRLPEYFSFGELEAEIDKLKKTNAFPKNSEIEHSFHNIRLLAQSNFTMSFSTDDISERAIYPSSPSQSNGLEDARFVKFTQDDGQTIYYATFTAYNGKTIMPELLETHDFNEFKVSTLNGPAAKNKGMALFPRKIQGMYMMLGRQDNESLYIMTSDNPYFWYDYQPLIKPTYPWELMQIGNCGSPIELDEGWLVLTHGVGPVRTYSLGAVLLDKENPWKVIGRLENPLLEPTKEERFGYVPNVLYSCGSMLIDRTIVLPYAIGDVVTTFALIQTDDIIKHMKWV